jgi:hypothetical protein
LIISLGVGISIAENPNDKMVFTLEIAETAIEFQEQVHERGGIGGSPPPFQETASFPPVADSNSDDGLRWNPLSK